MKNRDRHKFNPKRWVANIVFVSLDLLPNVVLLGSPTESMSSRMGRAVAEKRKGFSGWLSRTICSGLNWLDDNHCVDTWEYEKSLGQHRPEAMDDKQGD